MPYCPICGAEYVEGILRCADCGRELVEEPAPRIERGDPEVELVEIWCAGDEVEAQMLRGLLEASGIECMLRGESLRLTHAFTVDGLAQVKLVVRAEDAERARDIIAQTEQPQP